MQFISTPITGAFEIKLSPRTDDRGAFTRIFSADELKEIGLEHQILQINHSSNKEKATIRGMHFQYAPFAEVKIIRCLKGRVFDVMVDLRKGSPSFLQWHAIELSPTAYNMAYVPEGCAHGFQTLEEDCELLYLHTAFYHPEKEGAIRYNDPMLKILWPLTPTNISEKDKSYPLLKPGFSGISLNS